MFLSIFIYIFIVIATCTKSCCRANGSWWPSSLLSGEIHLRKYTEIYSSIWENTFKEIHRNLFSYLGKYTEIYSPLWGNTFKKIDRNLFLYLEKYTEIYRPIWGNTFRIYTEIYSHIWRNRKYADFFYSFWGNNFFQKYTEICYIISGKYILKIDRNSVSYLGKYIWEKYT